MLLSLFALTALASGAKPSAVGSAASAKPDATDPSLKKTRMTGVQMYGKSGKFEVCPNGDCADKSMTLQVDFIRELDVNGKKVPQHFKENMASTTFTVGDTESLMMGEPSVNATKFPFSSLIQLKGGKGGAATDAVLRLDTYTFSKPTTVITGNTSVEIMQDAMKFDITVSGWQFEDPMNTLDVGIKLTANGVKNDKAGLEEGPATKETAKPDGKHKTKPTKTKKIDFGNIYFDTPLSAVYDGVEKAVMVSYSSSGGKSSVITFSFSSFDDTVTYDPTVGGNSGARFLPGFAMVAVLLVSQLAISYS
jgi:hypothetical protein